MKGKQPKNRPPVNAISRGRAAAGARELREMRNVRESAEQAERFQGEDLEAARPLRKSVPVPPMRPPGLKGKSVPIPPMRPKGLAKGGPAKKGKK
jgi:hypothetical protein